MKRIIASAVAIMAAALTLSAQSLTSGAYFIKNYDLRHLLNPAFAAENSYVALPVLSGTGAGFRGNVGVENFLFPYGDKLTTFMNGSVSKDEFLGDLPETSRLRAGMDINILSVGFKNENNFTTFGINLRSDNTLNVSKSLFETMKGFGSKESYSVGDVNLNSNSWVEIYAGRTFKISENVDFGAKVKMLVGLETIKADVRSLDITMNEDIWKVVADADVTTKIATKNVTANSEGQLDASEKGPAIGGIGVAADLGIAARLMDGALTLSAAVNDLGFISYGKCQNFTSASSAWEFTGFDEIPVISDEGTRSIGDQFSDLMDNLANVIRFKDNGSSASLTALTCKVNLGAEYVMPFYDRLSLGLLSTTLVGPQMATEARLAAVVRPVDPLSFSLSAAAGTYGASVGAAMNVSMKRGISFFLGADSIPGRFCKGIALPVGKANFDLTAGLSINF